LEKFDFLSDLVEENLGPEALRNDIKPLHIIQPEGVSFKLDGQASMCLPAFYRF
jgi:primary-amine oxidase